MKTDPYFHSVSEKENLAEIFETLGREYVSAWEKQGILVRLTRTYQFASFRQAKLDVQLNAINYLRFNVAIINEMIGSGESLRDTKRFLWRTLQALRLTPPAGMMNYIENEDVVEMYLMNEIQVFRNYKFLEVVSITIEDLLCVPWYRVGHRHWKHLLKMARLVLKFKLGLITQITDWNIDEHIFQEVESEQNHTISILMKCFIPLTRNGKVIATVSTNTSRVIAKRPRDIFSAADPHSAEMSAEVLETDGN